SYLVGGIVANTKSNILPIRQNSFSVVVQTLVGQRIRISDLSCNITIRELKKKIQKNVKFAPYNQRLVFNGQELSNIASLGSYEISMNSIIYMEIKPHDSYNKVKFIILDLIDPEYQFYFNKYVNDVIIISKDFLLTQGWKQVLLKVPNKQITINNEKINDLPEVGKKKWKISYHGTAKYLHRSIAEDGYLSGKKYQQFNFSHGIYTTPNIEIASLYAKTFTYNGVKFKVLFQNLVNTNTLGRIRTYSGEYWVSPSENDIRPFGFLVKKVDFL
ncbi:8851_t:CDS:1, partial [Scutellospora calospora]